MSRQLEDLAIRSPSEGRRLQLARHLIVTDRFTGLAFALRLLSSGDPLGTTFFDRVDAISTSRHTGPSSKAKQLLIDRLPGALRRLDSHRQERLIAMVKPYGIRFEPDPNVATTCRLGHATCAMIACLR